MSLQTRYRLLFIALYLALAYALDAAFERSFSKNYPFFLGMVPVLLGMYTANFVLKKQSKKAS